MTVKFESMVTWELELDRLRCNPSFYGRPRYDTILYMTDKGAAFGKLVYAFVCEVKEERFGIAYVQGLDAGVGTRGKRKDRELGLYRLRAKPRSQCEFIPVEAIVRGALVVDNPNDHEEYFVVDTIDQDIFVRIMELHKLRFPDS